MKVTGKGQVAIPVRIREYFGIALHSDIDFRIAGGTVVLVKQKNRKGNRGRLPDLRGSLRGTRTTREWMRATRDDCPPSRKVTF